MTTPIIVYTSFPQSHDTTHFIEQIIRTQLAACVQVSEIKSYFSWDNQLCQEAEKLLQMKTFEHLYPKLEAYIQHNHPYDVPEITSVQIMNISEPYLKWMKEILYRT